IEPQGTAVSELPARAGVSKEAISAAVGFLGRRGYANVVAGPGARAGNRGKIVALTARGMAARDAFDAHTAAVEEAWRDRFGAAQVASLGDALGSVAAHKTGDNPTIALGLAPHADGWRARGRYRAQTKALLADPWAALPRHPMVLHRG